MASYSATRWWSKWEVMYQVMNYLGDVAPFLVENDDITPATWEKLLMPCSGLNKILLLVALAAIID